MHNLCKTSKFLEKVYFVNDVISYTDTNVIM